MSHLTRTPLVSFPACLEPCLILPWDRSHGKVADVQVWKKWESCYRKFQLTSESIWIGISRMSSINRNSLCYSPVSSLYRFFATSVVLKMANSCLSTRAFSARIARGGLNCCFCHWFPKGVRFLKRGMYMEEPPPSAATFSSVLSSAGLKLSRYLTNWASLVKLFWCESELFIISRKWSRVALRTVNILPLQYCSCTIHTCTSDFPLARIKTL